MATEINLAAQAKQAGKKPGSEIVVSDVRTTKSQVKDLTVIYNQIVNIWVKAVNDEIIPEYNTTLQQAVVRDSLNSLNIIVQRASDNAVAAIATVFQSRFVRWANIFQTWHKKQTVSKIKYKTNVDLSSQMTAGDVVETMDDLMLRNVSLVRNISDEARGRIADIIFRGMQQQTTVKDIAKELHKAIGMSKTRAKRVASDQVVKASASLDKERQLQLGISKFKWRHSGKTHYRPEHKARDGNIYDWKSSVAQNDPPGFLPYCGCKAQAVLDV